MLTFFYDSAKILKRRKQMRRVIDTLNEMSFELPEGYSVSKDKYNLVNGQGFINKENYLSKDGQVISLFEVHRDPDEFFEYYTALVKFVRLNIKDFSFPMYVIKGYNDKLIYNLQVFINCGDCLGCFMITLTRFNSDIKQLAQESKLFKDLIDILRTVE